MSLLEAKGSELEQQFAFVVVRQLLEGPVSNEPEHSGLFADGAARSSSWRPYEAEGSVERDCRSVVVVDGQPDARFVTCPDDATCNPDQRAGQAATPMLRIGEDLDDPRAVFCAIPGRRRTVWTTPTKLVSDPRGG